MFTYRHAIQTLNKAHPLMLSAFAPFHAAHNVVLLYFVSSPLTVTVPIVLLGNVTKIAVK